VRLSTLKFRLCDLTFFFLAFDVINKEKEYKTENKDKELEKTVAKDKKKSKKDKEEDWEIEKEVKAIKEDKSIAVRECIWLE